MRKTKRDEYIPGEEGDSVGNVRGYRNIGDMLYCMLQYSTIIAQMFYFTRGKRKRKKNKIAIKQSVSYEL